MRRTPWADPGRLTGVLALAALLSACGIVPGTGNRAAAAEEGRVPAPSIAERPGDPSNAAPEAQPDSPGAKALRQIAAAFLPLQTFEAKFEQTQTWIGQDPASGFRGTLYLMRPNLFRIQYEEPKGHLQVSDGKTVWTYVPENGEVLATRLSGEPGEGGDLLRWILERGRPESETRAAELEGAPVRIVTIVPPEGIGLSRVRIWTPPDSPRILQYEVVDTGGNGSTYRLLTTKENPGLDRSLFNFRPPDGVPVVELGSP